MRVIIFLLLLLLQVPLYAQNDDDIVAIRQIYQETKKTIAKLGSAEGTDRFYCDFREKNTFYASWPGTGTYNNKTWTYYKSASFADTSDLNRLLVFIDNKTAVSAMQNHSEWLFDDGQLIFYYSKSAYDNDVEKRAYFKDGRLIRYMEGKTIVAAEPKIASNILQEAKLRQKHFVLSGSFE